MSFQAMAWAVEQELPALQKLTLLLLANYAGNETGECWPSLGTIAKQAGMSRDSVMRAIREMENAGLLTVVRRTMEGVNLPNIYRLNLSAPVRGVVADSDHEAVADSVGGSRSQRVGVVADSDSNLSVQPIKDPPTTRVRASVRAKVQALALPLSPIVIELPLNVGVHAVTEADVTQLAQLYPAANVRAELLKMRRWCDANPARRKTARGIAAFIANWFDRVQNEGSTNAQPTPPRRPAAGISAVERVHAANAAAGHQPGMFPDDDRPF